MSSSTNIPYLDGWRGLAIVAVLVSHFGVHLYSTWMGTLGVQLFFALSGYLMADLLFIKKVDIRLFFKRRFSRILPTMVLFVTSMAIFSALSTGALPGAADFFSTLLFLRTYFPSDTSVLTSKWFVGNLWSLNVEEHSYIYLAVIAVIGRKYMGTTTQNFLLALTVAVVLVLVLYYPDHPPPGASPWYSRSETACLSLIASATLRVMREKYDLKIGMAASAVSVGLVAVAALSHAYYQYRGFQYHVAPIALAIAINYLQYAPPRLLSALSFSPLRWFGRCSFSIYLWQQPFYLGVIGYQISNLAGLVAGIAVGTLSFYLFEDPIRKRINALATSAPKQVQPLQPVNVANN